MSSFPNFYITLKIVFLSYVMELKERNFFKLKSIKNYFRLVNMQKKLSNFVLLSIEKNNWKFKFIENN